MLFMTSDLIILYVKKNVNVVISKENICFSKLILTFHNKKTDRKITNFIGQLLAASNYILYLLIFILYVMKLNSIL